ncbi:site-specific integrase [Niveibacterium microcysteis]|uniref:Site-specific integrase n=1 Tax=Niveibacterium microcysteis TaxID=2811415 RepID=A0ABX7MAK7_9RHOO|nr:site-specific integrase [Niveibacterium microcysteis]QSI78780.1 site-specific integrase [Niveibacterium microcysteis]
MRHFVAFGGTVPASGSVVANYIAEFAGWHTIATIQRRLNAIRHAHAELGLPSPTDSAEVRAALRGAKRRFGSAQRQAEPVTRTLLSRIIKTMARTPLDYRDRALLLLGFAGAFRRSELEALCVADLKRTPEGILIRLKRSKTDQEQIGRSIPVPATGGSLCPVRALESWLKLAKIDAGPVFRRLARSGRVREQRLSAAYISEIVKQRVSSVGEDPDKYSAHSLRAGLVTEAARAGVPSWKIRQITGHRSDAMLSRYIRDAELWQNNAATKVLGAAR